MPDPDDTVEERLALLNDRLADVERMGGADGELARSAVSALVTIYGEALRRAVEQVHDPDVIRRWAGDDLLGHLMTLHALHPDPPERRIADVLDAVRGDLGVVELGAIDGGIAKVRMASTGCSSEAVAASVRDLVLGAAPELADVDVETHTEVLIAAPSVRRKPT